MPLKRFVSGLLGFALAAFLVGTALPHRHAGAAAAHVASDCQLCQIQHSHAPASPRPQPFLLAEAGYAGTLSGPAVLVFSSDPLTLSNPRAPPVLS